MATASAQLFVWLRRCSWLPAAATLGLPNTWAAPPADALADRMCTVGPRWEPPRPRQLQGCAQAVCAAAGEQLLCACKTPQAWQYQHRNGGQVVQRWPTEVSPMTGAAAFEVLPANLSDDGRPRWLVARLLGISNGLGVSSHELCVVNPDKPLAGPAAAPACRRVSEWQSLTILVQEPGRTACSLMDSGWQSGREAGRGPGTYAAGRLWRWQDPQWQAVPVQERQAVARRLLPAFMTEREGLPQAQSAAGSLWYQHATAQTAACPGPLCPLPASSR